jgi:hypothetical protein
LEELEARLVPYALTGYQWANVNVSASFMPDGTTTDGGLPSNLFSYLNTIAPTATWQHEYARALQTWADVTPLNFHIVPDNGAAVGISGSAQGDSRFGDTRFGGYVRSDSYVAYTYYPGSSGTLVGDSFLNTGTAFHIGTYLDLYSTMLHETGHSIGLAHSALSTAVMYPTIMGVYTGLSADDIAGAQAIYGPRQADAYDAAASNNTLATATGLTLNSSGAFSINADITSTGDVDYYGINAPSSTNGSLTVTLDASQISLFEGAVSVYDASGTLVGTASATDYGQVVTLNVAGLTPGQKYYVEVSGATTDAFGMGAYKLSAQFGGVTPAPTPSLSIANVTLPEGNSGSTPFTFTVTLSAASTSTVTVQYATADGTATVANNDYVATSGTLTFAPGQTQQTVTVSVNGNTVMEPDETFYVNLSNPANATLGTSQGVGTIQNDDFTPDRYEPNNTSATATNLGRTNSVSQTTLSLDTATDVDYYTFTPLKNGTYTVTVTPTSGSGTISVSVLNALQVVAASGQSSAGGVTLSPNLLGGRAYYIKVYSPTGSQFVYNLSVTRGAAALALPIYTPAFDDVIGDGTEPLRIAATRPAASVAMGRAVSGMYPPGISADVAGIVVADSPVNSRVAGPGPQQPSVSERGHANPAEVSPWSQTATDLAQALSGDGTRSSVPAVTLHQPADDDGFWSEFGDAD